MLKSKIFRDSNREKGEPITDDQQADPDSAQCPDELSPYFQLSQNQHIAERDSNEYQLLTNDGSSKFFQPEMSIAQNGVAQIHEPPSNNNFPIGMFQPKVKNILVEYSELNVPRESIGIHHNSLETDTSFISFETIPNQMLRLQIELNNSLRNIDLRVAPVEYVYNPLEYAFNAYETFIHKYCPSTKKLLLVGMNPGPYGMCQTGIPFGDPKSVRDFLHIEETVFKPEIECPRRKILGFSSPRREQSGERLWSFFKDVCHTPENFFKDAFIFNFCPIALMKSDGSNVTPAEIKNIQVRKSLEQVCGEWYHKVIHLLQPECIIAIGTYIDKKTKDIIKANKINNIRILYMPHPSPRAVNNQNWHEKAQKFLIDNNLNQYFCR